MKQLYFNTKCNPLKTVEAQRNMLDVLEAADPAEPPLPRERSSSWDGTLMCSLCINASPSHSSIASWFSLLYDLLKHVESSPQSFRNSYQFLAQF